ncbi:MAG: hypothetical protein AAF492_08095, partial [Verrucomicrobiota bacterium]
FDRFGTATALSGDTIAVGAYGDREDRFDVTIEGTVTIFTRSGSTWSRQAILEGDDANDQFGSAVGLEGDRLLVGAPGADGPRGVVIYYKREGTNWIRRQDLTPTNGLTSGRFGSSIELLGTRCIIGDPNQGQVHIFDLIGTTWVEQVEFSGGLNHGHAVGLGGRVFAIGEWDANGGAGNATFRSPDFCRTGVVADVVRKMLYYTDADPSGYFDRDRAAFRYRDLLYGVDTNDAQRRIRARYENMGTLYTSNEVARSVFAENLLREALLQKPGNPDYRGLLLDIYYERMIPTLIASREILTGLDAVRLGPPSVTNGCVIDDEIVLIEQSLALSTDAADGHFRLLNDSLGVATSPPLGYIIYRENVPGRALDPAQYLTNDMLVSVTTNPAPLFNGYRDQVLLFDHLRDYGRTAADLAKLYIGRDRPAPMSDRDLARQLLATTYQRLYHQGSLLLALFPSYIPNPADPSGLDLAIKGWRQTLADLKQVQHLLEADFNLLGFKDDFLMLIQNSGSGVFDSYDFLAENILDPLETPGFATTPLGRAIDKQNAALVSLASYREFQDQVEDQFSRLTGCFDVRLTEIVGVPYLPDGSTLGYDTPEQNVGSEIWLQLTSISAAGLRIERNQVEMDNIRERINIELVRRAAVSNINDLIADVRIEYGMKQASLTETIGHIQAGQSFANGIAEIFEIENLNPGKIAFGAINAAAQGVAEEAKGQLEAQKERLAGIEQARVIALENQAALAESEAAIATWLLEMNTLRVDSQEAALLMRQEVARLVALYEEKADLERRILEVDSSLSRRFYADPTHRLQSQEDAIDAHHAFDYAQKWVYYQGRALEYKWNAVFDHIFNGRNYTVADIF